MSNLVVEVCRVEKIEPHPNADRMKIATVKGWKTAIRYDPDTDVTQFEVGDHCIFFPPDAILPAELSNGPDDDLPGRLNISKYLKSLPPVDGERPSGRRVAATRLRGVPSFGVIMEIVPDLGDDPDWNLGDDVTEHFQITKYEPPAPVTDGNARSEHPRFHKFSSPEHYGNYPDAIPTGEEVVFTEKIHGKNCRVGLVLDDLDDPASWTWMGGSHGVRREEFAEFRKRFDLDDLVAANTLSSENVKLGELFHSSSKFWKIEEVREGSNEKTYLSAVESDEDGAPVMKRSEFWLPLTDSVKRMLEYIRDELVWPEPKVSVQMFGEIFGSGVQDMVYGMSNGDRSFRAFDLSINNQYLDYDIKTELCKRFGVDVVQVLYRGPLSPQVIEEYTSGPSVMCDSDPPSKEKAKQKGFKGREGIVILPVKERLNLGLQKRCCLKSASADYLARKGGTEYH